MHDKMALIAELSHLSQAEVVRQAVEFFLSKNFHKLERELQENENGKTVILPSMAG
jgi:Arc/MetJ-type ribon-helix-helix transcriptional regulator